MGVHLFHYAGSPVAVLQRRSEPRFGMQCALEVLAPATVSEPLLAQFFGTSAASDSMQTTARWALYIVSIVGVLGAGWWSQKQSAPNAAAHKA